MHNTFPKSIPEPIRADILIEKIGSYSCFDGIDGHIIDSVAALHNAKKGSIAFCRLTKEDQIQSAVNRTKASIIITSSLVKRSSNQGIIVSEDPLEWFIKALNLFFDFSSKDLIADNTYRISEDCILGDNTYIGQGTIIQENCAIGNNCVIGNNCFISRGVVIGDDVNIQNNTCIGGVGLGYHTTKKNNNLFFPHLGSVIIGNKVVIGSGCVIVRGQLQDTKIGSSTRIGNIVNIGHNVNIGNNCSISSSTCIAGGVSIFKNCNIAAGVTINAKITIGNNCQIGLGSVVVKDILDNNSVFGNPAKPLPTMRKL